MPLTTDSWTGGSADWGASASNWSTGFPTSNSNVVINTASVQTIGYNAADTFVVNAPTVGNDFFDMTGGSLTITTTASFANGFTQTGGVLEAGGAVTIHGTASLTGGSAEGTTQFTIDGTVALANYTLGGAARLTNTKTTNLTGTITLGDNTGVNARIVNEKGATFNIAGDLEIFQGAASASFVNAGTLEKSAGTNTSFIDVNVTDTGTIAVATDADGWTVKYAYDAANRVTRTSYPDGTTEQYRYRLLDITSYKDRQGRVWNYTHDADRRLTSITDPLARKTDRGTVDGLVPPG